MKKNTNDIWLFAYGSLLWNPNFKFIEAKPALLRGYHRSLCIYSFRYRGTPNKPGLVMGLDHGGACRGIAYRVAEKQAKSVLQEVDKREMTYRVYIRKKLSLKLYEVRKLSHSVLGFAYIVNRNGSQYASKLGVVDTLRLIRQGHGSMGSSLDYLEKTISHLDSIGLPDRKLELLLSRLKPEG